MNRKHIRKRRKRRRLRRTFYVVLLLFLLLIGFGGYQFIQALQAASDTYDDLGRDKSDLRDAEVSITKDPVSILLMGVEDYTTNGKNGRTDTLMVATFNPNDERLKLLSIPRDTMVDFAGMDRRDKINHAH